MIIKEPTAVIMWRSHIHPTRIYDWANRNGIEIVPDTPLNDLAKTISHGRDTIDHLIEFAGRHCYRSWNTGRSHDEYITNILEQKHGSVLEHGSITFAISGVSRSLTHELVRHRAGFAYSQESQRYVDAKDMNFVIPPALGGQEEMFQVICDATKENYLSLQGNLSGKKKEINQAARSVLPNAAETRIVTTVNIRALRHFFEMRGSLGADPEIRRLAIMMAIISKPLAPHCLQDIEIVGRGVETHIELKYSKV